MADEYALCWDCANATGGCSWSDNLRPVKGWEAKRTHKKEFDSWLVINCPKFERDAYDFGLYRTADRKRWKEDDDE